MAEPDPPPREALEPSSTGSAIPNRGGRPASFDAAEFERVYDEALARTGKEPSLKELRTALGGGSVPLVTRHRDELRARRLLASGTPTPGTPGAGLLKALAAAQRALGAEAADAAQDQIDEARREADVRVDAAERQTVRARDEATAAALEREHARGQVVTLTTDLADAVAERRAVNADLARAREESRDLAAQVTRLRAEARAQTKEAERMSAAHDALAERLERREEALDASREARESAERRVEVLEATLAEARESAEREAAAASERHRETLEEALRRVRTLETALDERDGALAVARTETAVLAERLEGAEAAAREAALETRLADLGDGSVLARLTELERRVPTPPGDDDG